MAGDRVQRRLAAIVAADVVGYSRLMGQDEEGTLAALTAHRTQLIEPCITDHRGRIVKTTGDGLLAEFFSVVDAVRCAVSFQEGMRERNADVPEDRRIEFRIGVNLGDVIVQEDDVFGDGVNVAARLEGLADPGGIIVSGTVHEHVRGKLEVRFDDLGPHEFKNIADPVQAYRIGEASGKPLSGVSPELPEMEIDLPEKPSIAVLPFSNLSDDPEHEHLADGLPLGIQAALVKLSGLFLVAPSTTMTYRNRDTAAGQAGRELRVRHVLTGTVQRSAGRIRITV